MPDLNSSAKRNVRHADLVAFEQTVASFEKAWQSREFPQIEMASANIGSAQRHALLTELVLIDMEYRWRSADRPDLRKDVFRARPTLRDYVLHFPSLGPVETLPADVLAEEFRVRTLWGDRPTIGRFLVDYPRNTTELLIAIRQIRDQLVADDSIEVSRPSRRDYSAEDPRAPLAYSDYVLEKLLGSGGMGKVYRALQRSLQRHVAVKAMAKARQSDPAAIEQFVQEARILAGLRHPNIIGVHGLGRFPGGGYFLAMELVNGPDLQSLLADGPLDWDESKRIIRAVALAVEHAHQRGIIHCDLKPANVLVDRDGQPIVTDFGLAQLVRYEFAGPASRHLVGGTFGFAAPELLTSELREFTPAVDVYGLGALLFAMLVGAAPHSQHSAKGVVQHSSQLQDLSRQLPPQIAELCHRSLRPDPQLRLRDVPEFLAVLGD